MNLIRKGHRHAHRGIIGIESAIVMIAFVIVAAALAFVVLNMGFSTTQKAKTTIISSLTEASSALSVSGKVIGIACTTAASGCGTTPYLNATGIPIKVASGGDAVDLDSARTQVKYLSNTIEYDNIYQGALTTATPQNLETAFDNAVGGTVNLVAYSNPIDESSPSTVAFIYWSVSRGVQNAVLEQGEHATLAIAFETADAGTTNERPTSLDKMRVEIIVATGATLTVERDVPTLTTLIIDLG